MSSEGMNVLLILIIIAVTGWALYERYRKGQPITVSNVVSELHAAEPLASQILEVGQIAAQAAEQAGRGNPLMTNDVKLRYAVDFVKNWLNTWFPGSKDVKDEDIIAAINGGILTASYMSHAITESKANVVTMNTSNLLAGKPS